MPIPCSAENAAAMLERTDRLGIPLGPGQPVSFMRALGRRQDWIELTVVAALLVEPFSLFEHPGVYLRSGFFGSVERALRAAGHHVSFIPADFRRFKEINERFDARVFATAAAPPDKNGQISLSLHAGATVELIQEVSRDPDKRLIVETSRSYPRTFGISPDHPHSISIEDVDVWIEAEEAPPEVPDIKVGEVEESIAARLVDLIESGATLQTGIGGVPSAVVELLAKGSGGDYGIHSEMFTTGLMRLHEAGKISNKKGIFDGLSITTFAMGSRELYEWLDGAEAVRFLPVAIVNDPAVIEANRNMVAINSALSIDLFGQIVADSISGTQYSGIGGHEDFLAGTGRMTSGRSVLCLPSTVELDGHRQSRIVAELPSGSLVTSPRHQIDMVVSEFGTAELAGRTVEERALALVEIAHPSARDELRAAAREIGQRGVLSQPHGAR
ncbi:MAG: acetyl-CoA hydrolase/transferase C-terminal domain-containing protein [Myxococcota bacterium]